VWERGLDRIGGIRARVVAGKADRGQAHVFGDSEWNFNGFAARGSGTCQMLGAVNAKSKRELLVKYQIINGTHPVKIGD